MFYVHHENGITTLDDAGVDLRGITAARDEAVATVGEIFRDGDVGQLWSGTPLRIWVTDQPNGAGTTLCALHITATGAA
jgi:hypothetical protein